MATYSNLLQNVSRALLLEYDLERFLRLIMDALIAETQAEHGMIVVLDEHGRHQCKAARDRRLQDIPDPSARRSKTIINEVLSSGRYQFHGNALTDARLLGKSTGSITNLNLVSIACAPLRDEAGVFGVIYLDSDKAEALFNQGTGVLLDQLAQMLSGVIRDLQKRPALARASAQALKFNGPAGEVEVIIAHEKMAKIYRDAELLADKNIPVLLTGEPGTGKELVAQFLHAKSNRRGKWLAVDCGTLPYETLVSELFGHVRGAFTNARNDRPGLVAAARKGTLFLDEIGEFSLDSQARLLRFLEMGEYKPLGSDEIKRADDVRIITATNKNLPKLIQEGKFRQDLYDRLNDVVFELPPLRERAEEILPLAYHYLARYGKEYDNPDLELSLAAAVYLKQHRLRGNVRELKKMVRRAVLGCREKFIQIEHFDFTRPHSSPAIDDEKNFKAAKAKIVDDFERQFILARLRETGGKVKLAAKISGMPAPNFSNKMKKYGINPKQLPSE